MCHKIAAQPLQMPCHCSVICQAHLEHALKLDRNASFLICPKCHKFFDAPSKNDFRDSPNEQRLIDTERYLSKSERNAKKRLLSLLDQIEYLQNVYAEQTLHFITIQTSHFDDLENQIEKSSLVLQRLDETRNGFREHFLTVTSNFERVNVELEKRNLEEFFRNSTLPSKFIEALRISFKRKLELTQRKLNADFKCFAYDLKRNRFNAHVGKLTLSGDFLSEDNKDMYSVVTCSLRQKQINVLNLVTNSPLKKLMGHEGTVLCLAVYKQTKLISGSQDKTLRVWDLVTGENKLN